MNFHYYMDPSPELGPISDKVRHSSLAKKMILRLGQPVKTEGEIRPDDIVPVIAPDYRGNRKYFPMKWGFHAEGIQEPISTVAIEIARGRSFFKESWERRRCVIPAAYYFESCRLQFHDRVIPGDKYIIQPDSAIVTWFAGLYRIEVGYLDFKYPVFTILTTHALPDLRMIQDRMPLMIHKEDIDSWIRPGEPPESIKPVTDIILEKA